MTTHPVQLEILKNLLFKPEARFAELNTTELTNDQFTYHIKQLQKLELITKEENKYKLTPKGKEFAGRIDVPTMSRVRPPKVGIGLFIRDNNKFLLTKRKKDPSKDLIGIFTRKVKVGQSVLKAAKKCLKEETGLDGEFKFVGNKRFLKKNAGDIEHDVLLILFEVENISGELKIENNEGSNLWVELTELKKMDNLFVDLISDIDLLEKDIPFFSESIN